MAAQSGDGLMGIDAVGAAAIGDNLGVMRKCWEDLLQLRQGGVQRAGNVARSVLVGGPDIQHGDGAFREPCSEVRAADGFGGVLAAREPPQDALDLRKIPLRDDPQQVSRGTVQLPGVMRHAERAAPARKAKLWSAAVEWAAGRRDGPQDRHW